MAKLSDGSSFRFYRFASNFRTYAPDDSTAATKYKIDSGEFRLFHVPGRTMVPPVFWGRWAYFYLSGTDAATSVPRLNAYYWNELSLEFELKCEKTDMDTEGSNTLYHKYTMVSVGDDGIIFSKFTDATMYTYLCDAASGSFTKTAVQFDNTASALTGDQEDTTTTTAVDVTSLTLIQAREDPDTYVSGTMNDIYGLQQTGNSGYIQKFTWASGGDTLTHTTEYITVPIDHMITVSAEHLDIGKEQLVLLSPAQCAASDDPDTTDHPSATVITNAAAYFYKLKDNTSGDWVCRDLTNLQPEATNAVEGRMVKSGASSWSHAIDPPYSHVP